jgi:hypothetical protein
VGVRVGDVLGFEGLEVGCPVGRSVGWPVGILKRSEERESSEEGGGRNRRGVLIKICGSDRLGLERERIRAVQCSAG